MGKSERYEVGMSEREREREKEHTRLLNFISRLVLKSFLKGSSETNLKTKGLLMFEHVFYPGSEKV